MSNWLLLLVSGITTWLAGFAVYGFLKRIGLWDKPNYRSSHSLPTVRGGGLAILIPVLLWIVLAKGGGDAPQGHVAVLLLIIASVSFADDLGHMSAGSRLFYQLLAALFALSLEAWPSFGLSLGADSGAWIAAGALGLFLWVAWIAGNINAFNFMDGINGLAAGQAAITGLGIGLVAWRFGVPFNDFWVQTSFALSGAALGFLPHNVPKARMFMGDVGSASLGFLLAVIPFFLTIGYGWHLFLPLALLQANFVLDTVITLGRRIARGERWYEAHKEHFYQRLTRSGVPHEKVTLIQMGGQVIVILLLCCLPGANDSMKGILVFMILGIWAAFFWYAEKEFKRRAASAAVPA